VLMRGRAIAAVAFVTLFTPAILPAQTVDELVARYIAARGGYQNLKALQTVKITRTVATPFSDVRVVVYRKRPQLFRAEQGPAQPGAALVPRGVNPDAAWDTTQGKIVARRQPPRRKPGISTVISTGSSWIGKRKGTR